MDSLVRIEHPPTKRKVSGSNPLPCATYTKYVSRVLKVYDPFAGAGATEIDA